MKKASWEKRFDEKFNRRMALAITGGEIDDIKWLREEIKQLISQQISLTKKEMGKALRKKKRKMSHAEGAMISEGHKGIEEEIDGYNQAVREQNQEIDNYLESKNER